MPKVLGRCSQVTTLDLDNLPRTEDGQIDYKEDFFARHTSLTVSGQLEGEMAALALGGIYTFGPTSVRRTPIRLVTSQSSG